jgi:predicted ATPase
VIHRAIEAPNHSRLHGRDADRRRAEELFAQRPAVLTICGPPGVGKTALAWELATRHGSPVLSCDLSPARDPRSLLEAARTRWGIRLGRAPSFTEAAAQLGAALTRLGTSLVLLDNLEHLLPASRPVLRALFAAAPQVRFLATSRVPLGLAGERCCELAPLALDAATELFIERARAAPGGGSEDIEPHADVEALVAELDGLPLAIELAASRSTVMSAAQILARLRDEGLPAAATGSSGRFTDLGAAVDWSLRLLDDDELVCVEQCRAFGAGFTVDAAEAVVVLGGNRAVVDVLDSLRRHGLLWSETGVDGRRRLRLYHAVAATLERRQRRRLGDTARAPLEDTRGRLVRYYTAQASQQAERLDGAEHAEAARWLIAEASAIRHACDHARAAGDHEHAAELVLALDRLSTTRGPFHDQVSYLDQALSAPSLQRSVCARLLIARGDAHRRAGTLVAARQDLDRALELARGRAAKLRAEALRSRARIALITGQRSGAEDDLRACRRVARRIGDSLLAASAQAHLGELRGDVRLLLGALEVARTAGALRDEAYARWSLGRAQRDHGRYAEAIAQLTRALDQSRELEERRLEALVLGNLALAYHFAAQHEQARARYFESLTLHRDNGHELLQGWTYRYIGALEHQLRRFGEAQTHLGHAVALAQETGDISGEALARAHLAALAASRGDEAAAALGHEATVLAARGQSAIAPRAVALLCTGGQREAELATVRRAKGRVPLQLRMALVVAEAMRQQQTAAEGRVTPTSEQVLTIGAEGGCFSLGGERIDLSRRRILRRLLRRLAQQRRDAPNVSVAASELIEAGWPGQRVSAKAGSNRLRNAISTLRRLGLGDALQSRREGYLIAPEVPVQLER